eukprot:comp23942_c6_seq1/m.42330 comp23942_c6_seq1/g.42330  ORF comp23942_c6_seq1/g.42330 comp23942_c6_seq1/m.42330 type:complete len:839 (-) comp23942_c6_seq1:320-2836(-)
MSALDFVGTIEDDEDVPVVDSESEEEETVSKTKKKPTNKRKRVDDAEWDKDFIFRDEEENDATWEWSLEGARRMVDHAVLPSSTSIDEKIERKRAILRIKKKAKIQESEEEEEEEDGEEIIEDNSDEEEEDGIEVEDGSEDGEEAGSGDEDENEDEEEKEEQENEDGSEMDEDEDEDEEDEVVQQKDVIKKKGKGGRSEEIEDEENESEEDEEAIEREKKKRAFFSDASDTVAALSFTDMNLSRPILRAVTAMGYVHPTPVQAKTIPVALMAKDICACAKTGSGKTAAFMLPVLERLLYRPRANPTTRVLVLLPTRELAAQCHAVCTNLAQFTDITMSLVVGGLSGKQQMVQLRNSPDVIIATPGRLIDHIHNTQSFDLGGIEVLIMDEADRLLELGFKDEIEEVVKACPKGRQTMLFSATMTDEVDDLVSLSLHEPVRLFVDRNTVTASNLIQEFIRIRPNRERDRDAILLALVKRTFKNNCIIFFRSKASAHRMKIIFGLMGLKASELHGNLTQAQRLESLEKFKHGEVDFLLATDLASRGLDISGVQTVINFTMPHNLTQYIHRVGRTARAGQSGRSITMVGEGERLVLKEVVKNATEPVRSRVVPNPVIEKYRARIEGMEGDIKDIMRQEREEKLLAESEREATRAQNMIVHEKEIFSRPAKTWFQDAKEKEANKEMGKLMHEGKADTAKAAADKMKAKKEKKNLTQKQKKMREAKEDAQDPKVRGGMMKAVRDAKRAKKGKRLHAFTEDNDGPQAKKKKVKAVGFDRELTDTSKKALAGMRGLPPGAKKSAKGAKGKSSADQKKASEKKQRIKELRTTKSKHAFKTKKRYKRR